MITVVVTSWMEPVSIKLNLKSIILQLLGTNEESEIILICPDDNTIRSAQEVADSLEYKSFKIVKDPQKGKPFALNLVIPFLNSDIIIMTDGDVCIEQDSLQKLISYFKNPKIGAVTGRPVNMNPRRTFWGYSGHLFADIAHKKRTIKMNKNGDLFFLSGYLFAMRNFKIKLPPKVLDDVYYSLKIYDLGYKLAYSPDSIVYIKQPTNIKDWIIQKGRNLTGSNEYLHKFKRIPPKTRNYLSEIKSSFDVIFYSKNFKELFWSFLQFPLRICVWIYSLYNRIVLKKNSLDLWSRVESTK